MDNHFKLARAKQKATWKTIRMMFVTCGTFVMIVAAILTAILSLLFKLNALVVFAGALFGLIIVCLKLIPVGVIWRSELFLACQESELWDVAEKMLLEDGGEALKEILDGKVPTAENDMKTDVWVAQALVLFSRKGETRKSQKLCEYQYRKRLGQDADNSYDAATLAAIYIERGSFQRGIDLALKQLDTLTSENRKFTPSYATTVMALIQGYLYLHKKDEARRYLVLLRESLDASKKDTGANMADDYIRSDARTLQIEEAFYWLFLGQVEEQPDAEIALTRALDIMKDESLQRLVTLHYPEINLALADLKVREHAYADALEFLEHALDYYDKRTIYRGAEYVAAKGTVEYCKLRLARGGNSVALQEYLDYLEKELEPVHPKIATSLVQLAYSHISEGNLIAARESLKKALSIRTLLFEDHDPEVAEVHELIKTLESSDGGKTMTGLNAVS